MESAMTTIQWRDGNWVESCVIQATHEVLTGQGVFETILVDEGTPLFLNLHLNRLSNSSEILGIAPPDVDVITAGIHQLLRIHNNQPARLRVSLFGGTPEPVLMASLVTMDPWPTSASVLVSPWTRNENSAITGAKSASYAENAIALKKAKDLGYCETLFFTSGGHLAEAATSNIAVVVDARVLTPALRSGCLPGITRAILLELGVVSESDIDTQMLGRANAAALLSSTRGVQPLHALGDRELNTENDLLAGLVIAYEVRVKQEKENWAGLH